MKIGISAYPLARKFTGTSVYLYNIIKQLHKIDDENQYFLYAPNSLQIPFEEVPSSWHLRIKKGRLNTMATCWMQFNANNDLRKDAIDIFWATESILPINLPSRVKTILTVYDLTYYYYPSTLKWDNRIIFPLFFKTSLLKAHQIITISESVALEIKDKFPKLRNKIKYAYPGICQKEFRPLPKTQTKQYIADKFHTSTDYLLTVSTIEPRKNIENLLKAYALFRRNYPQLNYPLLIAGGKGWQNSSIYRIYKKLKFSPAEVKFLNYVPQEDLVKLYNGAELFIFPSLYEGFGFPPLEAMACGCPVLVSNIPIFKEILNDAAIFVEPLNIQEISEGIYRGLTDINLKENLIQKGLERVQLFSWEKTAKTLLELFTKRSN
ncbi:MAG: glycosyltransferase family 1 protein [bacterium]